MIVMIATMKVAPENQAPFEEIMRELSATVREREPGVTLYQLAKVQGTETSYRMIERYESQDAFRSHVAAEWFQTAFPKFSALLAEPPVLEKLTPVG